MFHAIIGGCKNEGKSVSERRARLGTGDEGDCAHDDTACVRMMTESGIMLWRHLLVGVISSKSLIECYALNLRPETWRWWLSGCPRKHLFFARRVQIAIHHSPYIVDSRSDPIPVGCTIFRVARRYFRVFFPMALVRPSQNGERAGPLAKMLLGAKHGGRPRIMSRIIVEEYFAL